MVSSNVVSAMEAIDHIAAAARAGVKQRHDVKPRERDSERLDLLHRLLTIANEKGQKVDFSLGEVKYEAYVAL